MFCILVGEEGGGKTSLCSNYADDVVGAHVSYIGVHPAALSVNDMFTPQFV